MNRKSRLALAFLLLLAGFVGIPVWSTWRAVRQERLDRALLSAIKKANTQAAIAALNAGADPNTIDEEWAGWIKRNDGPKWVFSKVPALTRAVAADNSDMPAAFAAYEHYED